jgi:hypothetical protein
MLYYGCQQATYSTWLADEVYNVPPYKLVMYVTGMSWNSGRSWRGLSFKTDLNVDKQRTKYFGSVVTYMKRINHDLSCYSAQKLNVFVTLPFAAYC